MEVVVKWEWQNFKDEAKLKDYYEFISKYGTHMQEDDKKYNRTRRGYSNGTGYLVSIHTFKDAESFAKYWNDVEEYKMFVQFCRHVKKMDVKVLRPTVGVPPK